MEVNKQRKGLVREFEEQQRFAEAINKASEIVSNASRKPQANFIFVSQQFAEILDELNKDQ